MAHQQQGIPVTVAEARTEDAAAHGFCRASVLWSRQLLTCLTLTRLTLTGILTLRWVWPGCAFGLRRDAQQGATAFSRPGSHRAPSISLLCLKLIQSPILALREALLMMMTLLLFFRILFYFSLVRAGAQAEERESEREREREIMAERMHVYMYHIKEIYKFACVYIYTHTSHTHMIITRTHMITNIHTMRCLSSTGSIHVQAR
jgi:hypothetical protein